MELTHNFQQNAGLSCLLMARCTGVSQPMECPYITRRNANQMSPCLDHRTLDGNVWVWIITNLNNIVHFLFLCFSNTSSVTSNPQCNSVCLITGLIFLSPAVVPAANTLLHS